jgi:predicted translin family RNA/ssDNA-binding protein
VVGVRIFTNRIIFTTGEVMIDYSEMFIHINQLGRDAHNNMNDRKMEEARSKIERMEMAVSMLKKYLDWTLNSK